MTPQSAQADFAAQQASQARIHSPACPRVTMTSDSFSTESAVYFLKVREAIKALEADGWYLVAIKGDHRQFKHHEKSGKVTIAGSLSKDIPPGTLASIFRQAQLPKP